MISKQDADERGTLASHRSLFGWLVGVAIGAAALMAAVVFQAKPADTRESVETPAAATNSATVVVPIDHSVVRSIESNAEPDASGVSIAAYDP